LSLVLSATYLKPCEPEVTHFDLEVSVDENVLAFNVAVYDTQRVHVLIDSGSVKCDFEALLQCDINLRLFHVE